MAAAGTTDLPGTIGPPGITVLPGTITPTIPGIIPGTTTGIIGIPGDTAVSIATGTTVPGDTATIATGTMTTGTGETGGTTVPITDITHIITTET